MVRRDLSAMFSLFSRLTLQSRVICLIQGLEIYQFKSYTSTVYFQYNEVKYHTVLLITSTRESDITQIWTHNRRPIPHSYGRAILTLTVQLWVSYYEYYGKELLRYSKSLVKSQSYISHKSYKSTFARSQQHTKHNMASHPGSNICTTCNIPFLSHDYMGDRSQLPERSVAIAQEGIKSFH